MAGRKWKGTQYPGVRYREHPKRKHGVVPDKYFSIYYRLNKKLREEGCGWASQGMTAKKASIMLGKLREAHLSGEGPQTLSEKRNLAEAKRKKAEAERKRKKIDQISFGDFWRDTYFPQAQRDKTVRTWKREASFFKKWLGPGLAEIPMATISLMDLEEIKARMAKAGLAPRSIAYCIDVARQVFNQAATLGLYEGEPPTAKVKKPRADNQRLRFLSQAEAAGLLKALAEASTDLHDMALLSLHCGLRAGELFSLRWQDVDLVRKMLTLRDTKNKRTRPAFLNKSALSMLKDRAAWKDNELVFPSRTGKRRQQISKVFGKTVDALGLNDGVTDRRDKVVFHTLRHTFASWLVMAGKPLFTVGNLLGHSTSAMTERYSHLAPDHMREAVQVIEKGMDKGKAELDGNTRKESAS